MGVSEYYTRSVPRAYDARTDPPGCFLTAVGTLGPWGMSELCGQGPGSRGGEEIPKRKGETCG